LGQPGPELRSCFATPLMTRRLASDRIDNARLRAIVLERERVHPGIVASNVGAWHSTADLMDWDYPEIRALTEEFLRASRDMTAAALPAGLQGEIRVQFYGGCWANVLRDGGYNTIHNHPGAVWSGSYYVSVGVPTPEPRFNGWIEFQDPRPANIHGQKERICPEPGLLILFPSWLNHYVNPFRGDGERISIAFNVTTRVLVAPDRIGGAPGRAGPLGRAGR